MDVDYIYSCNCQSCTTCDQEMINIFYICKLSNFPLDLAISVGMCKKDLESASPVPIFKCAVMTLKLHRHLSTSK